MLSRPSGLDGIELGCEDGRVRNNVVVVNQKMLLGRFRYALGKPGQGFHRARWFGLARNDIVMTLLAAIATAMYTHTSVVQSMLVWFVAGIVAHWVFDVPTAMARFLYEWPPDGSFQTRV